MLFGNAPWLVMCGGLVSGKIQKSKAYATDFFLLTRSMLERPPKDDMERWTTIAWAIWRARNKFCFEDFQPRPEAILCEATSLHEYQILVTHLFFFSFFLFPGFQASMYSPRAHQDLYLHLCTFISLF